MGRIQGEGQVHGRILLDELEGTMFLCMLSREQLLPDLFEGLHAVSSESP